MNKTQHEEDQMRERIINLIHAEKITQRQFAINIGREPSNVHSVLTGARHFPRGFCADIIAAYPKVSKDWLYFGEGSMYEGQEEIKLDVPTDTRPRLPRRMVGGHLTDYYEGDKRSLCQEKPRLDIFSDYDFTIILKTDRMLPNYRPGDELAFKKDASGIIEWGNDYLIDTESGPKFKKIKDGGDCVICQSYNKEVYQDFTVPKNKIYGYYKLVGFFRVL